MPREHGAPKRINPKSLDDYLEVMSRPVFQAGISWAVVDKKWTGIKEAFRGFDAGAVAGMTDSDLARLSSDERVIRSPRKLAAVVHNARKMVELDDRHGSFQKYLRSHPDFETALKSLRKEFKFLGDMGGFYFLYVVGENVPEYDEFCETHNLRTMGK